MLPLNSVHQSDIFDLCAQIDAASVDMILCDLPYGTTPIKWDAVIPFEPMWAAFKRIIKPNAAIVLTASQPFTSALVMSNPAMFRHEWIWDKVNGTNPGLLKWSPFKVHESVLVFSINPCIYYPQKSLGDAYTRNSGAKQRVIAEGMKKSVQTRNTGDRHPRSIIEFSNASQSGKTHPTQKPVALFEYLIRTYTQEGDLVFDPCVGSGTTAVAARNTGRNFIVGDADAGYIETVNQRLSVS